MGVEREGDLGLIQAELPWARHPHLAVKGYRGTGDAQSQDLEKHRTPITAPAGASGRSFLAVAPD